MGSTIGPLLSLRILKESYSHSLAGLSCKGDFFFSIVFNQDFARTQKFESLSAETLHQLVENFDSERALFAQGSFAKEISSFHFCLPRLCKEKPEC